MKRFEIPMVVTSLLGLCFLPDPQVPAARADFTFGPRVNLGPTVNTSVTECAPIISRNGLELYFYSAPPGVYSGNVISVSKRASVEDPWGPAVNLAGVNGTVHSISSDGLTLYLDVMIGNASDFDLYTATRPALDAPWGPSVRMGPLLNSAVEWAPVVSPDDLELYFASNRAGRIGLWDIYVSTRATPNDPWGPPVNLGPTINTAQNETPEAISPDGLVLFFVADRAGGFGRIDTWMTWRPSKGAAWSVPVNLGPSFNTPNDDTLFSVSADGRWAYIGEYWAGPTNDVWMVPILPIVDFNGDGKVDGKEVMALAQHWGQNYPPCDIAPFAWGDSVVDVKDLTVLAGYIGQEVNDPTLIAHWALDEAAGMTAADSAGNNPLMVLGNAVWQPGGGKIGGALAFDGKDDFVKPGKSVLDPAKGPFSVIAWVKGGAANRVIVSQTGGADWLYPNQYGMLTTDLKAAGKDGKSLTSSAYVLDDQWHRVALVWDGTHRTLQMDGVQVAGDTQPNLAASSGSLTIGAGMNLSAASFWTGLIDEVRIYDRAVEP